VVFLPVHPLLDPYHRLANFYRPGAGVTHCAAVSFPGQGRPGLRVL